MYSTAPADWAINNEVFTLVSYPGQLFFCFCFFLEGAYRSSENQLVYSTAPADGAINNEVFTLVSYPGQFFFFFFFGRGLPLFRESVGVFYSPQPTGQSLIRYLLKCHIQDTHWAGGVLPFCKGALCVFCCLIQLGQKFEVSIYNFIDNFLLFLSEKVHRNIYINDF